MALHFVSACIISLLCHTPAAPAESPEIITYGSAVELDHQGSATRLYFSRMNIMHGMEDFVVTAAPGTEVQGTFVALWNVRESSTENGKAAGSPVKCGSVIRLQHVETGRNLHILHSYARLSNNLGVHGSEHVSSLCDFVLECQNSKEEYWKAGVPITLQSVETGAYLHTNQRDMFNPQNCPRCSIMGHSEVSGAMKSRNQIYWSAAAGLLLSRDSDNDAQLADGTVDVPDEL